MRSVGALLIAVALIFGGLAAREFVAAEACLDSGGSFNYSSGTCDHAQNHPYAPSNLYWPLALFLGVCGGVLVVRGSRRRNAI